MAGASFLRLPPRVPPDGRESVWLGVEGLRGFVWGGGKWFAAGSSGKLDMLPKRKKRREQGFSEEFPPGPQISKNRSLFRGGRFRARAPERGRYVDWVVVNGTNYTLHGGGGRELVYSSDSGSVLDFNLTG